MKYTCKNDINMLSMICQYDMSQYQMGDQARGRVAELLDELRQTVGAQHGSYRTVYLDPL